MQIYNKTYQHIDSEDPSEDAATEQMLPEELAELLFDVRAEREAEAELSKEIEAKRSTDPRPLPKLPPPPPAEASRHRPLRRASAPVRGSGSEVLEKFPRPGAPQQSTASVITGSPRLVIAAVGIVLFAVGACAVVLLA